MVKLSFKHNYCSFLNNVYLGFPTLSGYTSTILASSKNRAVLHICTWSSTLTLESSTLPILSTRSNTKYLPTSLLPTHIIHRALTLTTTQIAPRPHVILLSHILNIITHRFFKQLAKKGGNEHTDKMDSMDLDIDMDLDVDFVPDEPIAPELIADDTRVSTTSIY